MVSPIGRSGQRCTTGWACPISREPTMPATCELTAHLQARLPNLSVRATSLVAGDAKMVFPEPVGILEGDQILQGLKGAPRWKSVDIGEKFQAQLGQTIVLAYKATGRREDAKSYSALCSSTYVRDDGRSLRASPVMAAGYAFGPIFRFERTDRMRWLTRARPAPRFFWQARYNPHRDQ
jgi:hypothetical protein